MNDSLMLGILDFAEVGVGDSGFDAPVRNESAICDEVNPVG